MHVVRMIGSTAAEPGLVLHPALANVCHIEEGQPVSLRCGWSRTTITDVRFSDRLPPRTVVLASRIARSLSLPTPIVLRLKCEPDGTVALGPFIGIMAQSVPSRYQRFMSQTPYFAALARMGKRLALPTYVFTAACIDWDRQRLRAWVPYKAVWKRVWFPLPDVVYDRVQSRRLDSLPQIATAKQQLQRLGSTPIFNNGFFDKWHTHQLLNMGDTAQHVPDTQLLTGRTELNHFARRYATVYVKPAGGSLGQGIYVLQRSAGPRWSMTYYGKTRTIRQSRLRQPDIVWRRITRTQPYRRHVVQRGINFALFRGSRFDVRLIVQKDGTEQWAVSAMYARVAPIGSMRANLDAGGRAVRCSRVFRHIFGRSGPLVQKRVAAVGISAAKQMDSQTEGPLGELGIDVGVDRQGHVWIIEVNSKPLRQMDGPQRRLLRTLRRPLRYAQRLAEF